MKIQQKMKKLRCSQAFSHSKPMGPISCHSNQNSEAIFLKCICKQFPPPPPRHATDKNLVICLQATKIFQFESVDDGRWRRPSYKLPWSLWLRWAKNLLVSPRVVGTHFKCWGASYQYPQCIRRYQIKIETCFLFNLYHSLGIFSRRQNDVIFLIFPRKQDLTFHANCLLRRQFAWNVKSFFWEK